MTQKLKIAIAGYGVVGQRRRKFIDLHPNMQVVAVCDQNYKNAGKFEDGVRFCPDYHALLQTPKLDVLFVSLPNYLAAEVTMAGLKNGCHVFCEKPPGRDMNDIVQVRNTEKKNPALKLMYGFNHRYHDSVQEATRIIQAKELGEIINLRGVYGKSKMINFDSDWRTKRALSGGGILLDQGIHMVDMIRLFAGEFQEIHSFVSNSYWNHDVEDNAYALMRTQSGVVAMLHSSATQWKHSFRLEITLTKGTIILSGILSSSKSYGSEKITVIYAAANDCGDPREQITSFNHDHSWSDEINEFAKAILENKSIYSGSSEDAFKTMELVYRVYCADERWRKTYNLSYESFKKTTKYDRNLVNEISPGGIRL
ncbi:Gfo/Idh/MocA family oxidoreductase [Candidatus Nomurabacteria bacterium]|nr:Gfo/Idh/MocA family oxidoreductase [Candidatus Nomurabacteria bacterium]